MADAVAIVMDRMIPELEDLQRRGIFSPEEIRQIVQTRRDAEYLFKRRAPMKEDFLRAIAYELQLETLRRKRKQRLSRGKSGLGDRAGIRRIHLIFNRALRRFGDDAGLWLQYIDYCYRTHSVKRLGQIFARALALHGHNHTLWIQAATWFFDRSGNVPTARVYFQRGLRLNPTSQPLLLSYFKMELLYLHRIFARRLMLGLRVGSESKSDNAEDDEEAAAAAQPAPKKRMVQSSFGPVDSDEDNEDDADDASSDDDDEDEDSDDNGAGQQEEEEEEAPIVNAKELTLLGAIPRLVFMKAMEAVPDNLEFASKFLTLVDELDADLLKQGPTLPAVVECRRPLVELTTAILAYIQEHFAADPNACQLRADRAVRELAETAVQSPSIESVASLAVAELAALSVFDDAASAGATVYGGAVSFIKHQLALPIEDSKAQRARIRKLLEMIVTWVTKAQAAKACSPALWHDLVLAHRRAGNTEAAVSAAQAAVAAFPQEPSVWLVYSDLAERLHAMAAAASTPSAVDVLTSGLDKVPKEAQPALVRRLLQVQIRAGTSGKSLVKSVQSSVKRTTANESVISNAACAFAALDGARSVDRVAELSFAQASHPEAATLVLEILESCGRVEGGDLVARTRHLFEQAAASGHHPQTLDSWERFEQEFGTATAAAAVHWRKAQGSHKK